MPPDMRKPAIWNTEPLAHVKRIIAVASGKGGVGKSTVTLCLALAAAQAGKRVGILDADIYGPSMPRMLGLWGKPEYADGMMQPHTRHNIACMSVGFLTEEAAILRGPMITKILGQMLRGTRWGTQAAPLDILFVDMPPGTGDVHLSMVQQVPLSGAMIVTTPQEIAVIDARKAAQMFGKVNVPILGVVENMSYLKDATGAVLHPFGQGGGARLAAEFGVELLAKLPLEPALGAACDAGEMPPVPGGLLAVVGKL